MGRQNERTGPLGCGHLRGLFLVSQNVPCLCNGKCNWNCSSALRVGPIAFYTVFLRPIWTPTLSVLMTSLEVSESPTSIAAVGLSTF